MCLHRSQRRPAFRMSGQRRYDLHQRLRNGAGSPPPPLSLKKKTSRCAAGVAAETQQRVTFPPFYRLIVFASRVAARHRPLCSTARLISCLRCWRTCRRETLYAVLCFLGEKLLSRKSSQHTHNYSFALLCN